MFHKTVNLALPFSTSLITNNATCGISRSDNEIFVKILSPYVIKDGEIASLYINRGSKTNFSSNFNEDDYRIDYHDGVIDILKYNISSNSFLNLDIDTEALDITVDENILFESKIVVPFSVINLNENETFGAAFDFFDGSSRQNSYVSSTIVKDEEIDPLSTMTYLRFSSDGTAYFSNNNDNTSFLYYYHGVDGAVSEDIPNNADRIYMTYERNDEKLVMYVIVNDTFGTHFNTSYNLAGSEAINIFLNLDSYNGTAWALYNKSYQCYDVNLRIYSDDTICYINSNDLRSQSANQMWWSDYNHNNGVAKNFTLVSKQLPSTSYEIQKNNGYTLYTLTFTYDDLLNFGGAPEGISLSGTSNISTLIYEVSETSKTTIRFYTSSGNAWVFKNKDLVKTIGAFSSQNNYVSLVKN